MKEEPIEVFGTIRSELRNGFTVMLDAGHEVFCSASKFKFNGREKRIVIGDRCLVHVSVYDISKGQIKRLLRGRTDGGPPSAVTTPLDH